MIANNDSSNKSRLWMAIVITFVITIFSFTGIFDGLKGVGLEVGSEVTSPFHGSLSYIDEGFGLLTSLQTVRSENMRLVAENADLHQQLAELKDVKSALGSLSEQSKIIIPEKEEFLQAEIIQFDRPDAFYIYIGLADVRVGDFVASGEYIIGEVSEVLDRYALAKYTTVEGTSYPVRVGNTLGTMEGTNSNTARISRVDNKSRVEKGDGVRLAEARGPEPVRFLIGVVDEVSSLESSALKEVRVSVPVAIDQLTHAIVVPNHD